jgi:hypothetical protein
VIDVRDRLSGYRIAAMSNPSRIRWKLSVNQSPAGPGEGVDRLDEVGVGAGVGVADHALEVGVGCDVVAVEQFPGV